MNANTECVDRFVDHLTRKGQSQFSARDLAAYTNTKSGWPWPDYAISRGEASTMLQVHRQDHRKRYVLGCTGHGRYAEWYVADSQDAERMLQRAVDEHAQAVVRDITFRVDPAAAMDPAVARTMNHVTRLVRGNLSMLVGIVGGNAVGDDED